ncbi:hypothetical protein INT43_001259 [Umbelopsis isabellina]|uniref:Something about silencing protein 4 domain-containing protein n=1 Tax=Mortierella isabellina TaxID=91625 RepID=A0A8H7UBM1_MORIS|nr:hypothetical protein INT43_001259 [Umbelopsis isabellina]
MPGVMTRRSVTPKPSDTKKRKRQESQKREMPSRHSLLADVAIADLEEELTKASKRQFSGNTTLHVSSDPNILKGCDLFNDSLEDIIPQSKSELQSDIKVPSYKLIDHKIPPASRRTIKNLVVNETTDDETYLRRHRKHELGEKRVKNREKEQLRYDMHQQIRHVERLKSMDRTNLLATISSQLRRDGIGELDEAEVKSLHQRMIREAEELLMRYEALGLLSGKQKIEYTTIATPKHEAHRSNDSKAALPSSPPPPSSPIAPTTSLVKPKAQPRKRIKLADNDDNTQASSSQPVRGKKKKLSGPQSQDKPVKGRSKKVPFGQSSPAISHREFSLPAAEFGEMMLKRGRTS